MARKKPFENVVVEPIVWKDRKRIMGLPLTFTRYSIRGSRLYLSKGFFNVQEDELLLYRVLDMSMKQSFGNRLVGVGTLVLSTADATHRTLEIQKIKRPRDVRNLLSQLVEEERRKNRITGKEMFGTAAADEEVAGVDTDGDGIPDTMEH